MRMVSLVFIVGLGWFIMAVYNLTCIGRLNDLWMYHPPPKQWTWLSGSNQKGNSGSAGSVPGSRSGHSLTVLGTTGNLTLFGGFGYDATGDEGMYPFPI